MELSPEDKRTDPDYDKQTVHGTRWLSKMGKRIGPDQTPAVVLIHNGKIVENFVGNSPRRLKKMIERALKK